MKPSFARPVRDINLRAKLVLFFFIVSIIPILTLGLVAYRISANVVQNKVISENLNRLESVKAKVEQVFQDKQFTAIKFGMDAKVLQLLTYETDMPEDERNKVEFDVKKLLFDFSNINGTSAISIVSRNHTIYTNDTLSEPAAKANATAAWSEYADFLNGIGTYMWKDAEQANGTYVLPLLRKIVNPELQTVGLLMLQMKEELLADTYKSFELDSAVAFYIVNGKGNIISALDKRTLGRNVYERFRLKPLPDGSASGSYTATLDNGKFLVVYITDEVTKLRYISLMPVREMLKSTEYIKSLTLLICSICLFVCLVASLMVSDSVTKPMRRLIRSVEDFQRGDLNASFDTNRNDEIGRIGQNYSSLLNQLRKLIQDFYDEQQKKKEAEIRALEFQINPHFLYNTLSTVVWLCEENDNKAAIRMTKALANFFRISISRGKERIRVSEELSHAMSYVDIQNVRYEGNFTASFEVDPAIRDYWTPKIMLQPLVENAIYHGMKHLNPAEKRGMIVVKGRLDGGDIVFEVRDNGGGMDDRKAAELNRYLGARTGGDGADGYGIGIANVHDRVRLHCGEGYGLTFRVEDGWTVAQVRIQAAKEDKGDV